MSLSLNDLFDFLQEKYKSKLSLKELNQYLYSITGIKEYFTSKNDFNSFREFSEKYDFDSFSTNNREWGDIQTPKDTTDKICAFLKKLKIFPDLVIEPTYGTGNFILSSLEHFPNIKKIYGIEFHKNYEWSFKSKLLFMFLNSKKSAPEIELFNEDIFNHTFDVENFKNFKRILILGNPPWVTNTELSFSKSSNLPDKSNFKKLKGIDAITGKSNFDLAEYIILQLLEIFSDFDGELVMLCKNTVIKNLVKELPNYTFKISNMRSISIDSQEIFHKSVDASLLFIKLGTKTSDYICNEISFENPLQIKRTYGWVGSNFVSNVSDYTKFQDIDGKCCFGWRSGIKHDCASILELTQDGDKILNKSSESLDIESDILYPLLKGSMLKDFFILKSKKFLILTQKKINEDTEKLKKFPKLWNYLHKNLDFFNKRKSIIYKKNLDFSIFGVGDYSFSPYKVAIAGMYKEPKFSLCIPIDDKPILFDDTCYFLSFEFFSDALFTNTILNSQIGINFLKSISFLDSKRPYTKEILSRIDLGKLCKTLSFKQIQEIWKQNGFKNNEKISNVDYKEFIKKTSLLEKN